MSDLSSNKIFGAGLATALIIAGLAIGTPMLFKKTPPAKPGYAVAVVEEAGGAAAADVDSPPDWGTVLPTADVAAGEAKTSACKACHMLDASGANNIGPGLYGVVGRKPGSHAGFAYSAGMTAFGPFIPVIGTKRFQPVYVDDVGDAAEAALASKASRGKTYLLGGPGTYTMHEMLAMMLDAMGRKRKLVQVPMGLASLMAAFAQFAPGKPLTPDQVHQLESDNVVPPGALGFAALGLQPEPLEAILPQVMARFRNPYIHAYPAA